MRRVFLVALREYIENASTKGFWIGILMFPAVILLTIQATMWLAKAAPVCNFVIVDQSGELSTVIDKGMDRIYQRDVLNAFAAYAMKYRKEQNSGIPDIDLETISASDLELLLKDPRDDIPEALDEFIGKGGLETALNAAKPYLREGAPPFPVPQRRFRKVELPATVDAHAEIPDIAKALRPFLCGDQKIRVEGEAVALFAAVLIPKEVLRHIQRPGSIPHPVEGGQRQGIQYWASNLADKDLKNEIERLVNDEVRGREYKAQQLDAAKVRAVHGTYLPFASLNPKKEEGKEEVSVADEIHQWAPVGFVYLLWIAIFTISQMLLANTIEEKSNRIIEVLLSSITPGELMMGKLAGIAAVGLTVTGSWLVSLVVILGFRTGAESEVATLLFEELKTSHLLPAFCIYFLFGYLLYAGIFLAIGSVCNTLKEAQNMMGPIMLIMMMPLLTMMFIPRDPNGTLATVLSWIPLFTPFVMMNRAAADPPLFDVVGSMAILILFTVWVLWMAGRIFRVGILRTGQPPKLIELFRWLKA